MNTKFLKRKSTHHQEHQASSSDEFKSMINDIADLPGCIEKINQKIQNIEKHISKKAFDTSKVRALLQPQEHVNSNHNNNDNNEALNLKNIVKASVDNVSDVLNFDKKKKFKQVMKQTEVNSNVKTTLKKTDTKKKMIAMNNNVIHSNNNSKTDTFPKNNKQLEMSSDNLLKHNNVNSNSTSKKYSNSQNSFIYCDSNNVVKLNSKYDMKISSNDIHEDNYRTNYNIKNEISEKSPDNNKNTCNNSSGNTTKNFCFKPKVKKIVNEINDNIQKITENNLANMTNHDTNTNTNKTGISITNPNNDMITSSNTNNNSKQNKSFIERSHFKRNNNLKGNPEYKKPITAHPTQHANINANHSNKNSDLQSSNLKLNTFKLPSKHVSSSIKSENVIYNREIPKNANIEDIIHFMLFYNEYIISSLPKQTAQNVKDTFVNYSNVLAKLITIPKQSHIDLVKENNKIKKIICIQRKWREHKVNKLAAANRNKVECELKEMLVNNFIEKEGTLIKKVIGLLNASLETFSQAKSKEMFVSKLVKISSNNNNHLSDDERNKMYKEYINSKLNNDKRNGYNKNNNGKYNNGGNSILFSGNEDKLSYRLLSSIVSIQDTPQK